MKSNHTLTLYGIKNCDTMKKARAWLDAQRVQYAFHDYKQKGIDRGRLREWCKQVGWLTLLNRAGRTFRNLSDEHKRTLDEDQAIALMISQPTLIKRPVLEYGAKILVGLSAAAYDEVLRNLKEDRS